jgi:hypothetical protein
VALLLKEKADVSLKAKNGKTALFCAACVG